VLAPIPEPNDTTGPAVVMAGAIRLAVAVDGWRFTLALDPDATTGQARDIAGTVALVTGCDVRVALAAVLEAITSPAVITFEAAA
jgi:hypothetical protein